jgi:signal peptidase I
MVVELAVTELSTIILLVVAGNSMFPTYEEGKLLFADSSVAFEDIKVGDIIAFTMILTEKQVIETTAETTRTTIVHRVMDIVETDQDDKRYLITIGDNNENPIEGIDFPIYEEHYRGKVMT